MISRRNVIGLLGLAATLSACASSSTVQQAAPDKGIVRSFNAPYDKVKQAAVDALVTMRTPASKTEDQPDGFVLLISRPPHGFSWGEVGRVVVEKGTTTPVNVRVVYEKRFALQFAGSQSGFARNLYAHMDKILGTVASN